MMLDAQVKEEHFEEQMDLNIAQQAIRKGKKQNEQLQAQVMEQGAINNTLAEEVAEILSIVEEIKQKRESEKSETLDEMRKIKKTNAALQQRLSSLLAQYKDLNRKHHLLESKSLRRQSQERSNPSLDRQPQAESTEGQATVRLESNASQNKDAEVAKLDLGATEPTRANPDVIPSSAVSETQPTSEEAPAQSPTSPQPPVLASVPQRVNINTATKEELRAALKLDIPLTDAVIENRPYRFVAELVLKGALSKATYEAIRDKISTTTAGQ